MSQPYQHTANATQTPPGWYPDPMGGGGERYWDGIAWSEHFTRPAQPAGGAMAGPAAYGTPVGAAGAYAPGQMGVPAATNAAGPGYVVVQNTGQRPGASDGNGMVIAGWVCAILFPLIGLIIGAVITSRNDSRGKAIVVVSIVMMVLSYLYFQSMAEESLRAAGATGATGAVP